ncbi:MAG: hypothetical protein CVV61_00600 [Tenericutes bacterium HGW-Tenericutes-6]|jgi:hypothetical protein|nr:MAG: hypothetical protein CVV61_00600 [Tenericutes bacterium HGW-Tenericutes-6]
MQKLYSIIERQNNQTKTLCSSYNLIRMQEEFKKYLNYYLGFGFREVTSEDKERLILLELISEVSSGDLKLETSKRFYR